MKQSEMTLIETTSGNATKEIAGKTVQFMFVKTNDKLQTLMANVSEKTEAGMVGEYLGNVNYNVDTNRYISTFNGIMDEEIELSVRAGIKTELTELKTEITNTYKI